MNIPNSDVKNIFYNREKFLRKIDEIEFNLRTHSSFRYLFEDKKVILLVIVLSTLFFDKLIKKLYQRVIQNLIKDYKVINSKNIKEELFGTSKNKTVNYILSYNREGNVQNKTQYYSHVHKSFADIFYENTIKDYIAWKINAFKQVTNELLYLKLFFIDFISKKYELRNFSSSDINSEMVKTFVLYLISNENKLTVKKLAVSTKKEFFTSIKKKFKFIIDNEVSKKHGLKQLTKNPCDNISFKNVESYKNHYEPLPEEIYWQIMEHINELDIYIQNAFIILSATGFRWSEIIGLEIDCLYKKNNILYIKSIEHKTKKNKLKQGKYIYRRIPLFDKHAINAVENQISILKQNNYNSDFIFTKRTKKFSNTEFSVIGNNFFNDTINKFIENHNITTENGEFWRYTTHQMRVRIATLMAENGFESEEIASFLNHVNTTINKAYAFVRKKRMSELNTNFFKEHFNSLVPVENMNKLTKREREELYIHLTLDYRQMERIFIK